MTYYTDEERQQLKEKWIARIENWQNSNLTGAAWCKQEEVSYRQYLYWKKLLIKNPNKKLDSNSFVELDSDSDSSGIEIVIDEISIRLSRDFDSLTLRRCLQALKTMRC